MNWVHGKQWFRAAVATVAIASSGCGRDAESTPQEVPGVADAVRVSAGLWHSCVVQQAGTVRCWGRNDRGQLAGASADDRVSSPIEVSLNGVPDRLVGGGYHGCALIDEAVRCWGDTTGGQLAVAADCEQGSRCIVEPSPVAVPAAVDLAGSSSVADGYLELLPPVAVTCAVDGEGQVWCWGSNDRGQLGDEAVESVGGPVRVLQADGEALTGIVSIAVGAQHGCAVDDGGEVWCWGDNRYGQLGVTPTAKVTAYAKRVPGVARAAGISAGTGHSCALLRDGAVLCWGWNVNWQVTDTIDYFDGDVCFDELGRTDCVSEPTAVPVVSDVVAVSAGGGHSCALSDSGTVWCWGSNQLGELGRDQSSIRAGVATVLLPGPAASIATGDSHVCAALSDGRVYCWGSNEQAQLGLGN